jgi:hypothetical protein
MVTWKVDARIPAQRTILLKLESPKETGTITILSTSIGYTVTNLDPSTPYTIEVAPRLPDRNYMFS